MDLHHALLLIIASHGVYNSDHLSPYSSLHPLSIFVLI